MITYTLKIEAIRKETEDTITLCFKQPGLKKVKYVAGQYLTLIFRINGRRYIRPYSFSSAPIVDQLLEVTIKRVLNGIVSNHIHDTVKVGDTIEVMPPMGDFVFKDTGENKHIYLWGTGSGITPLISLAKAILFSGKGYRINLFYGNRNSESTIFLKDIKRLDEMYANSLVTRHFHTRLSVSEDLPNVVQGRIDKEVALNLLKTGQEHVVNSVHYICGASGFKESVKDALSTIGIKENQIFSEDFELVKDPRDFAEITTQQVRLNYQREDHVVEVIKGKSILEAALDANIEVPYSCQTGNCSTCKGTKIRGEAKMIGLIKERKDLEAGEFLLCCTYPISENLYIKID